MAVIGQVIDDKYEVLKLIGSGGMSKVYLAMDKRLNKQWAIKEIEKKARDRNNEIIIQTAIAEANLIKRLNHPAIVRIVDIIENSDVIYIVEDYIEGEPLHKILENNGAQPQELVVEWAMQICEALEYLHTRRPPIIYRDMKPANVMLKPEGNIMIIDFGIAREYKDKSLADTARLGTKGYAAPEQFNSKGQTDARTDIFCLGMTLFHLVTGQNPCNLPPSDVYSIRRWNAQLSAGLEEIIEKCTRQAPENRYQSCAELQYALHHYEEYGAAYRAKQKKKLKLFAGTALISLVCLLCGVLGLTMRNATNNADYTQNILQAEKASDSADKTNFYAQAVSIKPLEQEAYLGMLEAFKDDAAFSAAEEQELLSAISPNLGALRERAEYSSLAFEIGKLYWYYYDYGKSDEADNQITRMKSAVQWFEDAINYSSETDDFRTTASVYCDIGKFNRDITLKVEEGEDKGIYLPYWENIQSLVDLISEDDGKTEIVELEVYKIAVNAVESYARKFKQDGVLQADMTSLLKNVSDSAESMETTSDKTEAIKNYITERTANAEKSVENAYRD